MTRKLITVRGDTYAVLEKVVEVDDEDNNPGSLEEIAREIYDNADPSEFELDRGLDWEYVGFEVEDCDEDDEQDLVSPPQLTNPLLDALQKIVDINGSSSGPEGLVDEFKNIARLAIAQHQGRHMPCGPGVGPVVIRGPLDDDGVPTYWSNEDGWVDRRSATEFERWELGHWLPVDTHSVETVRE
jgi:hypothetical protein